jgi:site-specific recombinase XerD
VFITDDGHPLSPTQINQILKDTLHRAGINPHRYSSHSFRAGAATSAAAAGLPEWLIKALGRWSSDAYQIYITTPPSAFAAVPMKLCELLPPK